MIAESPQSALLVITLGSRLDLAREGLCTLYSALQQKVPVWILCSVRERVLVAWVFVCTGAEFTFHPAYVCFKNGNGF